MTNPTNPRYAASGAIMRHANPRCDSPGGRILQDLIRKSLTRSIDYAISTRLAGRAS